MFERDGGNHGAGVGQGLWGNILFSRSPAEAKVVLSFIHIYTDSNLMSDTSLSGARNFGGFIWSHLLHCLTEQGNVRNGYEI